MQIRTKGEELIKIKQEGSEHCYPCNNQQTLGFNAEREPTQKLPHEIQF